MGNGSLLPRRRGRSRSNNEDDSSHRGVRKTRWKKQETLAEIKERFINDCSLPSGCADDYIELRTLLEEPACQRALGVFAKKNLSHETFFS